MAKKRLAVQTASEIPLCGTSAREPAPWPRVVYSARHDRIEVTLKDRRTYRVKPDPASVLGFLHHMSTKTFADRRFFCTLITRLATVAKELGWEIHPCV